jgi:hypothetical protein
MKSTIYITTPASELVQQWVDLLPQGSIKAFTAAAAWGADQELEACCEWLSVPCPSYGRELRNARRPKPPSLKEQALMAINAIDAGTDKLGDSDIIRRALEALPE